MLIVDLGVNKPVEEAMLYEAPIEYVKEHVEPTWSRVRHTVGFGLSALLSLDTADLVESII